MILSEETSKKIRDICFKDDGTVSFAHNRMPHFRVHHPELYAEIMKALPGAKFPIEYVWVREWQAEGMHSCAACGGMLKYGRGRYCYRYGTEDMFTPFCCEKCAKSSTAKKIRAEKLNTTFKEKYGCGFGGSYDGNLEIKEKARKSIQARFGETVTNCSQAAEVKERKAKTCTDHYGGYGYASETLKKKAAETLKKRYGYANAQWVPEIKEKVVKTCIRRYGAKSFPQSGLWKGAVDWTEMVRKSAMTKRRNCSFNTSKTESVICALLHGMFPEGVEDHYSADPRYPYECDFYVPSDDLFIEVQGTWTHGKHPFDPASEEDLKQLAIWKEKGETSKYYLNAVDTWTRRDVIKRHAALANGLNYFEFFGNDPDRFLSELEAFIKERRPLNQEAPVGGQSQKL